MIHKKLILWTASQARSDGEVLILILLMSSNRHSCFLFLIYSMYCIFHVLMSYQIRCFQCIFFIYILCTVSIPLSFSTRISRMRKCFRPIGIYIHSYCSRNFISRCSLFQFFSMSEDNSFQSSRCFLNCIRRR